MLNHHSSMRRVLGAALTLLLVALLGTPLGAQPRPAAAPAASAPEAAPEEADLARAKELFRQGNELRKAGDYQRALVRYAESRALVPSVPNTMNAAFCLDKLRRFDEALELYESLLTELRDRVSEDDKQAIAPKMARLRKLVGSIDVQANVAGVLVIEGRPRGTLPLLAPVRALPGKRKVVVQKDGYRTFEQWAEVKIGKTTTVEAKLEPVEVAGRVSIAEAAVQCQGAPPAACAAAEVIVDGVPVGRVPWQGTLEPGPHWLAVQTATMGSAPQKLVVVKGQVVRPALVAAPLGAVVAISLDPRSAVLRIDGVPVGSGGWRGRLPLGTHKLVASEEGYFDKQHPLLVSAGAGGAIALRLVVDEDHARWGVHETSTSAAAVLTFVGLGVAVAGAAVGSILGGMTLHEKSNLEQQCETACTQDEIDALAVKGNISTAGFAVGGAGLALGLVSMIIWAGESDESEQGARFELRPYAAAGLAIGGQF